MRHKNIGVALNWIFLKLTGIDVKQYFKRGKFMKRCNNCGKMVNDTDRFCQYCGSSNFDSEVQIDASFYETQTENPDTSAYNNPYPAYNQQPMAPPQPKKKSKGIIVAIIAVILILFFIGIGFALGNNSQSDNSTSDGNIKTTENLPKVEYTKGTLDGTTYTNEWANIKFTIPEGFSNADSEYYETSETLVSECGLYVVSDTSYDTLIIGFEKLPAVPKVDEEEYMDIVMEQFAESTDVIYEIPDSYTTKTIANQTFLKATCQVKNGDIDLVQTYCVKKIDNTMVYIIVSGFYTEENNKMLENIEAYK